MGPPPYLLVGSLSKNSFHQETFEISLKFSNERAKIFQGKSVNIAGESIIFLHFSQFGFGFLPQYFLFLFLFVPKKDTTT